MDIIFCALTARIAKPSEEKEIGTVFSSSLSHWVMSDQAGHQDRIVAPLKASVLDGFQLPAEMSRAYRKAEQGLRSGLDMMIGLMRLQDQAILFLGTVKWSCGPAISLLSDPTASADNFGALGFQIVYKGVVSDLAAFAREDGGLVIFSKATSGNGVPKRIFSGREFPRLSLRVEEIGLNMRRFHTPLQVFTFQSFQVLSCQEFGNNALQLRTGTFETFEPVPQGPRPAVTDPLVPIQTQILERLQRVHGLTRQDSEIVKEQEQGFQLTKITESPWLDIDNPVLFRNIAPCWTGKLTMQTICKCVNCNHPRLTETGQTPKCFNLRV
ncbi:hypothetical protein FQN60_018008, partial [Etheostoma spectabile]